MFRTLEYRMGWVGVLCFFLLSTSAALTTQAADLNEALEMAQVIDEAVAQAAEDAIASVVRIEATAKISSSRALKPQKNMENPFEGSPLEDFFKQFFWHDDQYRQLPPDMKTRSLGSGIVLNSKKGLILTNNHVVRGAEDIKVIALIDEEEQEFKGKVKGRDPLKEIAVVELLELGDAKLQEAKLGDSDSMRVGQTVIAIGNPFEYSHSVSKGIISGKGRTARELAEQVPYQDFIQTDAAINPGNSGGPLLNLKGEVIGINTFITVAQGSYGFNGLGFAIPLNLVKSRLDELIEKGKVTYAFVGVNIKDVPDEVREHSDIPGDGGAYVAEVIEDSPADKVGIQEDDIILEFEGKSVNGSHDLVQKVGQIPVGEKVSLKVYRPGKKRTIKFSLVTAERPVGVGAGEGSSQDEESRLGITVQNLTGALADKMGYEDETGVLVTFVDRDGPSAEHLRVGDLILEVDWKEVDNVDDFWEAVNEAEQEKGVLLRVKRVQGTFLVVIQSVQENEK